MLASEHVTNVLNFIAEHGDIRICIVGVNDYGLHDIGSIEVVPLDIAIMQQAATITGESVFIIKKGV